MSESTTYPNVFVRLKSEMQRPGSPLVESTMSIWLKGTRFRARDESDQGVTEFFGERASDVGLLLTPDNPPRAIPARTIAKTAEQILVNEPEEALEAVGTVELFGRECTEYKGTLVGENDSGQPFESEIHKIVSPPYELFNDGRATDGSGFYVREVVEFSEGAVTDDDFIPPGEDSPIGPACGTLVRVLVSEGDMQVPWMELEGEIEGLVLLPDAALEVLDVLLGDVETSTPAATYLPNTKSLRLVLPSATEEVDEATDEVGLALRAVEQNLLAQDVGFSAFLNPEWSPGRDLAKVEVELTVRSADLADSLSPAVVHASARELMTDEWFWDDDDLAPLGSEDASTVVTAFALLHRKGELHDAVRHLDTALGEALDEAPPRAYWQQSLPVAEPDSDEWDDVICIDEMTIAAAFAQLAIQGSMDTELRRRVRLSLERQLELDVPDEWLPRVSKMLEIVNRLES